MSNFIFSSNATGTTLHVVVGAPAVYSLETAARLAGVPADLLRHYCQLGLLGQSRAGGGSEPTFDDADLYEVRRIEHYRRRHGVNRQALPLLVSLLREVEHLQNELRFLRRR